MVSSWSQAGPRVLTSASVTCMDSDDGEESEYSYEGEESESEGIYDRVFYEREANSREAMAMQACA